MLDLEIWACQVLDKITESDFQSLELGLQAEYMSWDEHLCGSYVFARKTHFGLHLLRRG